jgi:hypothetical protein
MWVEERRKVNREKENDKEIPDKIMEEGEWRTMREIMRRKAIQRI